jgi:uncharacterized protein (TIGR02594 family)
MNLPDKYAWLANEGAPQLLVQALKLFGIKEVPGPKHNPSILAMLKRLAFGWIKDDETPWCGTSLAYAAVEAGVAERNPEMPRAFWWLNWGTPVTAPMLGDVLVFTISHVGIYVGEDSLHYYVLGGNQGNAYNISRFPKGWLKGARRTPWKIGQPANVRRVWLDAGGEVVSTR